MKTLKQCLLLAAVTCVVFVNLLGNGFVGDDLTMIVGNDFYRSGHIGQVFSPQYLSTGQEMWLSKKADRGSGSVAFRPVTSLTYFMDHFLWKDSPFGRHAVNISLHVVNVILLFLLLLALGIADLPAFVGAFIFAVHPLQSEPVAAIAYRSDLLVTLFILLATLAWVRFRETQKLAWVICSMGAFFVALFSKETAILWPLWCLFYDRLKGFAWRDAMRPAVMAMMIVGFYVWVYFSIFVNTTLGQGGMLAPYSWAWLGGMVEVWGTYIVYLLMPWTVVPLPGLYMPVGVLSWANPWLWVVVVSFVMVGLWWRCASRQEKLLLVWAGIFFLPVSGLLVNPNPVACRYLYLPLAGIGAAVAACLLRVCPAWPTSAFRLLVFGYMAGAVMFTIIDNGYWKNNYMMGVVWTEKFPDFYKGHVVLGVELLHQGRFPEAVNHFEQALKDPRCVDPLAWHGLAYGYEVIGRSLEAQMLLFELKERFPWYSTEVSL